MAQNVTSLPNNLLLIEKPNGVAFKQCGKCYRKVEFGDDKCYSCYKPPSPLPVVFMNQPVFTQQPVVFQQPVVLVRRQFVGLPFGVQTTFPPGFY